MPLFTRRAALGLLTVALGIGGYSHVRRQQQARLVQSFYDQPLPKPEGGLQVYHLGHSLVGRDMPAMLAQLAGSGHTYDSQLGWGTSLMQHWEPDQPVNGFDVENDHPRFRAVEGALASGSYDALVLTEMVEIEDAIRYHDSADYLAKWTALARDSNPQIRIYLYETWHHTNDAAGWLTRIDADLKKFWQGRIIHPAMAKTDAPIHLIPAGQVMAAFIRALTAQGGLDGVTGADDLMARNADGTADTIHLNDLGAYLVALTHYAVLYHRSPEGLPFALNRADGTLADAPSPAVAALMQRSVWEVVQRHPETGVAA